MGLLELLLERLLELIGAILLVICSILAACAGIALLILVILWIIKYIAYFIKVPKQLNTIITSLETTNAQLASIKKQLNNTPSNTAENLNPGSSQTADNSDLDNIPEAHNKQEQQ